MLIGATFQEKVLLEEAKLEAEDASDNGLRVVTRRSVRLLGIFMT